MQPAPAARETSTPSPTLKRYARWILLAVALIGTPLAMGLLQPLPSAPPPAHAGGVLGWITVPRVGRVWVELGDAQRDQTRAAEAIHSMDPHVRIFPTAAAWAKCGRFTACTPPLRTHTKPN
jgi:hypothetical protein